MSVLVCAYSSNGTEDGNNIYEAGESASGCGAKSGVWKSLCWTDSQGNPFVKMDKNSSISQNKDSNISRVNETCTKTGNNSMSCVTTGSNSSLLKNFIDPTILLLIILFILAGFM